MEKGLETRKIYPGIEIITQNQSVLRWYSEIRTLSTQHTLKCCKLVKQCARVVMLPKHYLLMVFTCKDAEAELMRVSAFSRASNVDCGVCVVFPTFQLMQQQLQLFCMLPVYMVNVQIRLTNFEYCFTHKYCTRFSLCGQYLCLYFFQQSSSYKLHLTHKDQTYTY